MNRCPSADDWVPQGVAFLEEAAREALREVARNVCVTAGPGAGKTEFLAQKAAYLLQTGLCAPPGRILAISYKRDSARALADRVAQRLAPELGRRLDSMTFDAFTKSLVDQFRRGIPAPHRPPDSYGIELSLGDSVRRFASDRGISEADVRVLTKQIVRTPGPFNEVNPAVRAYWEWLIPESGDCWLSFPILNRLAEWLLRVNPMVLKGLRTTYPFVFLDEFQDTTEPQYDILVTAFGDHQTRLTAVGDKKQRIMGWAGALPDAFQRFADDFLARPLSLRFNWRSHPELVEIQRVLAERLDHDHEPAIARGERTVDGSVAAIWEFEDTLTECTGISAWLASEVASGLPPHEVAILVRAKATDAETALSDAMWSLGLSLRNVARQCGTIAIQDLLAEPLTGALVPLLRLGASEKDPGAWSAAIATLRAVASLDPQDAAGGTFLEERLGAFIRKERQVMLANGPSRQMAHDIARVALDFLDSDALRGSLPAYEREQDFERVWDGFLLLLAESTVNSASWTETLDNFEGIGQVPLMTIHKSKGLEFHTVLVYGLDDQSWWSLAANRDEELNAFFVAITRAKQRAFFTFNRERGEPVAWIERLLEPAGLLRHPGPVLGYG